MGLEGELKVTQETVNDLERSKKELEGSIDRKEKDLGSLSSKLEDEQSIVAKTQKTIKEIGARVEELEEELDAERQARAKAERKRSDLARELEQLGERLNEAGGATSAQVELNKKREAEVQKLRKDLEEAHIQQEATMMNLKRKHQDAVAEMSNKNLIAQLNEVNKKVEEANLTLGDFENAKRKLAAENADILRQLQELENSANMLSKYKIQLVSQLEETKKVADEEAKERHALLGKFKNLEHEVDGAKEQLDEEVGLKEDCLRQLNKACQESDMWRQKYESEGLAKAEELEMTKMKLQARLTEASGTLEQMNAKLGQVDKAKGKLQAEIA